MKKETGVLVLIVGVLVAFGVGRFSADSKAPGKAGVAAAKVVAQPAAVKPGGPAGDEVPAAIPASGKAGAAVTIIEISDFQCPFCSRVGPTLKKIKAEYPNDVRVLWANNALSFHNRAKPAAIAGLAAHRQGKFWEFHDKMFANQRALTDENFKKWAGELKLDVARFETDIKDPALGKQADREQAAATATGARGTPGFFINGKLLSGAQPFPAFKSAVEDALKVAKKHQAAGKTGGDLMAAAWGEHGGDTGTNVYKWFIKGETPVAPKQEARQAPKNDGPAEAPPESREVWKATIDAKNNPVLGDSSKALVTIVEYSDFECPFCSRGANNVKEVVKAYGDKVRVVWKHHPLPFHKNAGAAHEASWAAQQQGKFWEFHDKAFENQRGLTEENFVSWAKELGLDMRKFDTDRKSKAAENQIKADMAMAGSIKVQGTPNFLINGRKLVGAQPVNVFKAVIDEEIKKAEAAGGKGESYYNKVVASGKIFSELDAKVNKWDLSKVPFKGAKAKRAKIVVTEFSDFQCPYCSRVGPGLMEAMKQFKGKVRVQFAHYPLSFHRQAKPASVMAQEAFEQGGPDLFWKVHDDLFAAQRELSETKIKEIAEKNGVKWANVEKNRARHEKMIEATMAEGTKGGVRGTPSLFINGRKWEPSGGFSAGAFAATFQKVLDGKL